MAYYKDQSEAKETDDERLGTPLRMEGRKLTDLKESFPIELAEYAHNNKIVDEPAFAWWAYYVLKKQDRIIMQAKTKYWQKTHKYGVELPKTIEEAYEIDRKTNTRHWRNGIEK